LDGLLGFGVDQGLDLPLLTAVRTVNKSMVSEASIDLITRLDEVAG
jgi:NAD(P)H-hydrate repair Nnr-like enzyme with NAD(P)H-hydrate epimerase domain